MWKYETYFGNGVSMVYEHDLFLYMSIIFQLVLECRAKQNMLWLEDEFKTCILTEVIFMQNEYGVGK